MKYRFLHTVYADTATGAKKFSAGDVIGPGVVLPGCLASMQHTGYLRVLTPAEEAQFHAEEGAALVAAREAEVRAQEEYLAKARAAEEAEPSFPPDPPPDEFPDPGYEDWSAADLREECGKRHLSTNGNKTELADRLRADDEFEAAKK